MSERTINGKATDVSDLGSVVRIGAAGTDRACRRPPRRRQDPNDRP